MSRPAEKAGATGSVALLFTHFVLGVDDADTVALVGSALLLIPSAVTLLVANGGVRGALRRLWAGKTTEAS